MQPYELCVLFAGSNTPAELEEHAKKVAQLLADAKAEVKFTHAIGRKKLAYPIAGQTHGEYLVWLFEAESAAVQPLNEKLRLAPFVVRYDIENLGSVSLDERVKGLLDAKAGKSVAREEADELKEERTRDARIRPVEAVAPVERKREEKKASLEELDKKLDEILESDTL